MLLIHRIWVINRVLIIYVKHNHKHTHHKIIISKHTEPSKMPKTSTPPNYTTGLQSHHKHSIYSQ